MKIDWLMSSTALFVLQSAEVKYMFRDRFVASSVFSLLDRLRLICITVNYDIGNSKSLGFCIETEFNAYGHRVTDVHIKDRVCVECPVPLGTGSANFQQAFSTLKKIQYTGPPIMQAYRDDEGIGIFKEQLAYVKALFDECDIVAIIPARSGSKTVADKNIKLRRLPDAYSIAAAQLSKSIGRIIVSTDSEHYAEIARKYGAEAPFIRPAELSSDKSGDREFLVHAMEWMEESEAIRPEYWVHPPPNNTLRKPEIIDEAIELFLKSQSSTSSFCTSRT